MPFSSPFPFLSAVVSQATRTKAPCQLYHTSVQGYFHFLGNIRATGKRMASPGRSLLKLKQGMQELWIIFFFLSVKYRHFQEALQKDEGSS